MFLDVEIDKAPEMVQGKVWCFGFVCDWLLGPYIDISYIGSASM